MHYWNAATSGVDSSYFTMHSTMTVGDRRVVTMDHTIHQKCLWFVSMAANPVIAFLIYRKQNFKMTVTMSRHVTMLSNNPVIHISQGRAKYATQINNNMCKKAYWTQPSNT